MLRPTEDYVLVRPTKRAWSPIIEVVTSKTDQGTLGEFGEVIAIGPGKPNKAGRIEPLAVAPGAKVLYGGEGLGSIKFPIYTEAGIEYKLIQEADIVGIVE